MPELALVAGTRAFLGIGIGLLISGRLTDDQAKEQDWLSRSLGDYRDSARPGNHRSQT
jgi:hypothetical protein